jgi:23S rRNA pseudouridine1911/1915/1917 synthase
VLVDSQRRKAAYLLVGGESIEVAPVAEPPQRPIAEDLPLSILHEDDAILVIDKPAGMVVHPAPGSWSGTVVNALVHRGVVSAAVDESRPGIVHRLDKETSGVLLVAKTPSAHLNLSRAFHDREVKKTYLAVVLGVPKSSEGMIDWSIGRHPHERKRMSIRARTHRTARTQYLRVETFVSLSLLQLHPETGRTHQIRVHLAALGHPVLADPLYGSRKGRALPERGPGASFPRQALHASAVELRHPSSGEIVRFHAPLPEDMATLLATLRDNRS